MKKSVSVLYLDTDATSGVEAVYEDLRDCTEAAANVAVGLIREYLERLGAVRASADRQLIAEFPAVEVSFAAGEFGKVMEFWYEWKDQTFPEVFIGILTMDLIPSSVIDENTGIDSRWCVADIHEVVSDECFESISDEKAYEILLRVVAEMDASVGINWDVITYWVDEFAVDEHWRKADDRDSGTS